MGSARMVHASPNITPEQARDARARALAYAFSCWHTKQKDMPQQTTGDCPSDDNAAKEVSHVENPLDEASSIDHHGLTKENE